MKLARWIGTIHLPPLAGSPQSHQSPVEILQSAGLQAVREAQIFAQAGFDGIVLENAGDFPFYMGSIPPETLASLAIIAGAVREVASIQLGIRVRGQDALAALAIASVTGCDWIRMDSGFRKRASLFRERERLHSDVGIFAEVVLKTGFHSAELLDQAHALLQNARPEAVIVSVSGGGFHSQKTVDSGFSQTVQKLSEETQLPFFLELEGIGPTHPDWGSGFQGGFYGIWAGAGIRKGGQIQGELEPKKLKEWIAQFTKSASRGKLKKSQPEKKQTEKKRKP